jgi:hypothetical protein
MPRVLPALLVLLVGPACYPSFSFDLPGEAGAAGAAGEGLPAQGGAAGAPDGTGGSSSPEGGQGGGEAGSGGENIQGTGGSGGASGAGASGGILDDFEGAALGDGWSGNKQSFAVEGGALVAKAQGFLLWTGNFPATQEAWFRLLKPPAEGSAVGLALKGQWQGPVVCNRLSVLYRPGSIEVRLCKGGKDELLGAAIPAVLAAGDELRARYTPGNQVEVLRNGELLGQVDAASAGKEGSGRIGVVAEGQPAAVVDDFGGQ